jgi:hypothetical protein
MAQVEDVLSYVDQKTQGLCKKLTKNIDETRVDLKAIRMSVDMLTKDLLHTIIDTREHFHEELGLIFQVETQLSKMLIDTTRPGLEAKIAEVEARAEHCSCQGTVTGSGVTQTPKSARSTPWTPFRRQFETMARHNGWTPCCKATYLIDA